MVRLAVVRRGDDGAAGGTVSGAGRIAHRHGAAAAYSTGRNTTGFTRSVIGAFRVRGHALTGSRAHVDALARARSCAAAAADAGSDSNADADARAIADITGGDPPCN